jgi:hypothetical protein
LADKWEVKAFTKYEYGSLPWFFWGSFAQLSDSVKAVIWVCRAAFARHPSIFSYITGIPMIIT